MTDEEYRAAIAEYKNSHLEHGSKWKDHKYIRIENGRYIYPEDDAKLRNSSTARNYGAGNGGNKTSPKGEERDKQAMEDLLKKGAKVSGEKTSIVNEKNTNLVADTARVNAAKEYANDLTDYIERDLIDMLKGLNEDKDWYDDRGHLNKLIRDKGVKLSKDGYEEVLRMANTQAYRRINEYISKNEKDLDPKWVALWKKGIASRGDENPPFANRAEEIKNFEKKQKVKHSFDDPRDFYAAVYDYKQSHGTAAGPTIEHHGILGQKWGIRRYQNPDGTLTSAGKKRYFSGPDKTKEKLHDVEVKNFRKADSELSKLDPSQRTEQKRDEIAGELMKNDPDYRKAHAKYNAKFAKGATNKLNDLDQAMAFHKRDAADAEREQSKHERKAEKALEKGKYSKYEKETQKAAVFYEKAMKAYDQINKGHESIDHILSTLEKHGEFNVSVTNIYRNANHMKDTLKGLAVSTLLGPTNIVYYQNYVDGQKYKVTPSSPKKN